MERPERTVISQYDRSPTLRTLIEAFDQWIQPNIDIDRFYQLVWNVDTAQGIGLNIWARIVGLAGSEGAAGEGVGRPAIKVPIGKWWGYVEGTTLSYETYAPGGRAPFYNGQYLTDNLYLPDGDDIVYDENGNILYQRAGFRTLILAKAAANITDDSAGAMGAILRMLLPNRGNAYVIDNRDMTMTWHFDFEPDPVETAIVMASGVLPKPAGVLAKFEFTRWSTRQSRWDVDEQGHAQSVWDDRASAWDTGVPPELWEEWEATHGE